MFTQRLFRNIATLGPVGYLPVAPGTFGTAAGLLFVLIIRPSDSLLMIFVVISFVVGIISSHLAEISLNKRDPAVIVIDEFTGFLVSLSFKDITVLTLVLSFIFFRIFDILKPPPIKTFDKFLQGGLGIMMDDVMAGIYTNITVLICAYLISLF